MTSTEYLRTRKNVQCRTTQIASYTLIHRKNTRITTKAQNLDIVLQTSSDVEFVHVEGTQTHQYTVTTEYSR